MLRCEIVSGSSTQVGVDCPSAPGSVNRQLAGPASTGADPYGPPTDRPLGDCAWKKSVECWAASGGPADRQATGFVAVVLVVVLIALVLLTVMASLASLVALRRTWIRSAFLVGTGAALAGWLVTGSIAGLAVLTLHS
jgi:hypothetical protein